MFFRSCPGIAFECHAGSDASAAIRLDVLDEVLNQTSPRDAATSRLIEVVADGEMPPDGQPLSADQIKTLAHWIDKGMDWDETILPTPVPTTNHWAFQPIRRPPIPSVRRRHWVRTPIDAFIAAKHEASGLNPNPPADRATLNRRLSLDLLGLPPVDRQSDAAGNINGLLLTRPTVSVGRDIGWIWRGGQKAMAINTIDHALTHGDTAIG